MTLHAWQSALLALGVALMLSAAYGLGYLRGLIYQLRADPMARQLERLGYRVVREDGEP